MDKEQIKKLAKDPRFIPGIYNYCDRWCERCAFTSRCMNYALDEYEFGSPESKDIANKAFWDKLHGVFEATLEMVKETAEEMGIDLNAIDDEQFAKQQEQVNQFVESQPYTKAAFAYAKTAGKWFDSNKALLENKAEELLTLAQAQIPGVRPDKDALKIQDCLEVARWYQHQIYVKLCRAASGLIRGELESIEYAPEDANGSAKVAIIGIERSIAAWGGLLAQFPDQEGPILNLLVTLKSLLKQVDGAFPDARAFVRPGFDTSR
jgi:predicted hydrocarbon binding protein